jgi:pyruvate formate lyase activating enzyme
VRLADGTIECQVCPHRCRLREGQTGLCRVRVGTASSVEPAPGQGFVAQGIGTVEDHPLFHFYPGLVTLCVGSVGCSAACTFCQNWEIALAPRIDRNWAVQHQFASYDEIFAAATRHNCEALAFTYNEPTIWLEALLELATRARRQGLRTILVTNGFVTSATLALLSPHIDAVKLDLKGPDERFYRKVVGVSLGPVLESLRQLHRAGVWCEVSTVILPGLNDSPAAVRTIAALIRNAASAETPWHLMRFFPAYQQQHEPLGDLQRLVELREEARAAGLPYVYISNAPQSLARQTICPSCQQVVADRRLGRFRALRQRCPTCDAPIAGVGLAV